MTSDEILSIIAEMQRLQGELEDVEAKAAQKGFPKIYDSLSALSNRPGGGIILFGVDESRGFTPVGVYDFRDVQQKAAEAASLMVPEVRLEFAVADVKGRVIVAAEVPECPQSQKPCYYKNQGLYGGAYVRVGDSDRRMTEYEVYSYLSARQQARDDRAVVPEADMSDLDEELINNLLVKLRDRQPQLRILSYDRQLLLQTLNIVATQEDGKVIPTVAGILMFGKFPQRFFPSLFIALVMFAGTSDSELGPRGERFLDNRRFDGPIPLMLEEAEKAIRHNMRRATAIRGFDREDIEEYPVEAIREALRNAVVHRDYSHYMLGSHIQVRMFSDRLEIENPGGLYGPINIDTLGVEHQQSTRNAALMRMMEDYGLIENRGSGIRMMIESMRRAHLQPPQFRDLRSSFRVTFRNHTMLDPEALEWLGQFSGLDLNDRQRLALVYLRKNDKMTNADYRRLNSVDALTATRELQGLVRTDVVKQHGTRGGAYYILESPEPMRSVVMTTTLTGAGIPVVLQQEAPETPEEKQIYSEALRRGSISNAECRELLGIERWQASWLLQKLVTKGRLVPTGTGRWRRYVPKVKE